MGNESEQSKNKAAIWAFWGTIIAALITATVTLIVADKIPFPPSTTLTPTAFSKDTTTLNIYDTFDNSAYDGNLNQALWVVNANSGMTVYQENGKLAFQSSTPSDYGALWIIPSNGVEAEIQSFNVMEAKFSWDSRIQKTLYLGLTVQQSWTDTAIVAYVCDFVITDNSSVFHCSGTDGEEKSQSKDISIDSNQVYTLRVEVEPKTAIFLTYLNDSLVNTYQPPNPEKWLKGPVSYNLHLGSEPQSSGKGYIDDVKFGTSK